MSPITDRFYLHPTDTAEDALERAGAEIERLRGVIEKASTHLHNIAVGLEELRDKQRRLKVLESDKRLPDSLIPSAAIYGKAIRMTQRDLAAAHASDRGLPTAEDVRGILG